MIPLNYLQAIRFLFKFGYKLGAIPFVWDDKENIVRETQSKFRRRWFLVVAIYCFLNLCFMSVRWIQAACCMEITYGVLFQNLYNVITHAGGSAFYLNTYLHGSEIQDFVSHLMKTNERFKKNICPAEGQENKICGNIIKRVFIPMYFYNAYTFFNSIAKNNNPKYVYSLFNLKGVAKWKLIPIGIIECYNSFSLGTNLLLNVYIFIAYVRSTLTCLDVLKTHKCSIVAVYYKQLQIVNTQFHNLCKNMVLPATTFLLMSLTVVSLYATIKLHGEVKMPGFLGFPLVTVTTFLISMDAYPQSSRILELSEDIIQSNIKSVIRSNYNFKLLRACPPLKIHIGSYYYVMRSTFFTCMNIVIDNTVNVLLTF